MLSQGEIQKENDGKKGRRLQVILRNLDRDYVVVFYEIQG